MRKQNLALQNGYCTPLRRRILLNWQVYVLMLPALIYLIIFAYGPMAGLCIAFMDFRPAKGLFNSDWVGLKHFIRLFGLNKFGRVFLNTLVISLYSFITFPLPIILALLLNTCPHKRFKKAVQTVSYAPHFISMVVLVSMLNIFFAPSTGIIGQALRALGLLEGNLMVMQTGSAFKHLYVWSGVWQGLGWSSIIYLGALTGIDPALHESAVIDGANRLQRILHIDVPGILPMVVVMLIMRVGHILGVGFEKVFLMQNSFNILESEVISTYVYNTGIGQSQWSFSTAVGMFNSVVNFILMVTVNAIANKVGDNALW